jgi:ABC-type Mn2+/Zn2+ transport system permease subunit
MSRDRVIRTALWASVALNLVGVVLFTPAALGSSAELMSIPAPRFWVAQVGITIALFAGVYGWLAMQREIDRPLLLVGALGKLAFFGLVLAYWLAGDLPGRIVPQAAPDLVLGSVFIWWLRSDRRQAPAFFSLPAV